VSRTIEAYQRKTDATTLSISQYGSDTLGAAVAYGIPISETDTFNLGLRVEHTKLSLFDTSPAAYIDYVNRFGSTTNTVIASGGWARDTRDDILYPSKGLLQSVLVEVGLPIVNLSYYKVNYLHQWFWPVYSDFVLMLRGEAGYGNGYRGKPLPFFKAFYAGGVGSVRGYDTSSLGPRDAFENVTGGKRKLVGNAELFYPIIKGDKSVRASAFVDAGQIYADGRQPDNESFRYSAGVGLAWNSPIGPLKFSYGIPLNAKTGDRVQHFQFQVGTVF
jgi:outer membrane protein insertion porin family